MKKINEENLEQFLIDTKSMKTKDVVKKYNIHKNTIYRLIKKNKNFSS
jgi:transposase